MSDRWLQDVLRREGWPVYTDRAADRGGPTKGGITLRTLQAWRLTHGRPRPTTDDLKALEEEEAALIYRFWYLDPWRWTANDDLMALCADWSVTSGLDHPTRAIQRFLRVDLDGVVGPVTKRAYRYADKQALYCHVWQERLRFYVALVLNDGDVRAFLREHPTTQLHNLRGWLNRALDVPATPSLGGGRDATHALDSSGPPGPAPPTDG